MKKIAFINQPWNVANPPVKSGSIAIWTFEISRRLAKSNYVIVYARKNQRDRKRENYKGVEYRYFLTLRDFKLYSRIKGSRPYKKFQDILGAFSLLRILKIPYFSTILYSLGYIFQIARDIKSQGCEIVHIHNFSQFVPVILAFNPNVKIVLHMHCEWLTQLSSRMIKSRIRKVNKILGCSEYVTEKIRQKFPQFADKCLTIYNGVNISRFDKQASVSEKPTKDKVHLIFVGRLSPEKGLHVLLEAFKKVISQFPNIQLEIVGPKAATPKQFLISLSENPEITRLKVYYKFKSYNSQLMEWVLKNHFQSHVRFTGAIPYTSLNQKYHNSEVFINPSLSDAFPLSVLEAMASGLPVIATRVGGQQEVVLNGKTGVLVEPDNSDALADALLSILKDKALRKKMGEAGRERVNELFSWDKIAADLQHCYSNFN